MLITFFLFVECKVLYVLISDVVIAVFRNFFKILQLKHWAVIRQKTANLLKPIFNIFFKTTYT